jgi:hypothetical protein
MQVFILYFIIHLLICLNFYSKIIFESNQNNLNIIKSLISKIIYKNIFYQKYKINSEMEKSINNSTLIKQSINLNIDNTTKSK